MRRRLRKLRRRGHLRLFSGRGVKNFPAGALSMLNRKWPRLAAQSSRESQDLLWSDQKKDSIQERYFISFFISAFWFALSPFCAKELCEFIHGSFSQRRTGNENGRIYLLKDNDETTQAAISDAYLSKVTPLRRLLSNRPLDLRSRPPICASLNARQRVLLHASKPQNTFQAAPGHYAGDLR